MNHDSFRLNGRESIELPWNVLPTPGNQNSYREHSSVILCSGLCGWCWL